MTPRTHRHTPRRTCSCQDCARQRLHTRAVIFCAALWLAIPLGLIALLSL